MNKNTVIIAAGFILLIVVLQMFSNRLEPGQETTEQSDPIAQESAPATEFESNKSLARDRGVRRLASQSETSITDLAVKESLLRLRMNQAEEALLELDPLLDNFDALSPEDVMTLTNGYGNFYLAQGELEKTIELYQAALSYPDLPIGDRILLNRTLGQLSLHLQRFTEGVSYFDRYFELGGTVDTAVSLTLASSHDQIGNTDAALAYLLQHFELIRDEGRVLNPAMFERSYAKYYDAIASSQNRVLALEIANQLADAFTVPSTWKNLAELYLAEGQEDSYQRILDLAEVQGLYTDDRWLLDANYTN